jgi:PAS domain S-box-containing protein
MLKGNLIKIAFVDDDEDDYFIFFDYIKSIEGVNLCTEWISDYASAIESIKTGAFNIYFIDYRLGNETGLTLLREAIALGCEEPIVLLTGKGNKSIDIQAMQSGATDYLVKSELNTEKLERCIRYSLERAGALKELKERENKYRNLFTGSKDAVLIMDPALNIEEANDAASILFDCNNQDIISRNLCDFIEDEGDKKHILDYLEKGNVLTDLQIDISNNNNEIKPCLLSITFQKSLKKKWLVHGILHDITSLKRAEQANFQAQKLASNERLMRVMAHEIRNPLNNIALSVEHLEFLPGEIETQKEMMGIIRKNCTRINQSVTELLNLTRAGGDLEFQRHMLQDILDESIATVEDRVKLKGINVKKRFEEAPFEIAADKAKLKIAFSNILINAIEAMEGNSTNGVLDISMYRSPGSYAVSIQDNGIGISEENISKLFEPFFTMKKNGMGLGLAATYSILQSHKANIQVESKINKGTNFIINFSSNGFH